MPFTRLLLRVLDWLTVWTPAARREAPHIRTGRMGEEAAYFYLRKLGYVMVAMNWRTSGSRGELDLIGWDGRTLCFIEVKTRSEKGIVPAEMSVDKAKQRDLKHVSWLYRKRVAPETAVRFDIVSVYFGPPVSIELRKDVFS